MDYYLCPSKRSSPKSIPYQQYQSLWSMKHKYYTPKQLQIYKGYLDDQRNTDNAWVETVAMNFHDETKEIVSGMEFEVKIRIQLNGSWSNVFILNV